MSSPNVLWLSGGTTETVSLMLQSFTAPTVTASVDPNPPEIGRPTTLAVLVSRGLVSTSGLVTYRPVAGVGVQLLPSPWVVEGSSAGRTNAAGQIDFTATCEATGSGSLTLEVGNTGFDLRMPSCLAPTPTTTTVPKGGRKKHR
jgi:hypothetical protein